MRTVGYPLMDYYMPLHRPSVRGVCISMYPHGSGDGCTHLLSVGCVHTLWIIIYS